MANPNSDPTGRSGAYADPSAGTGAGSSNQAPTGGGGGGAIAAARAAALMGPPMAEFIFSPNSTTIPQPCDAFRVPPGYQVEVWPSPDNAGAGGVAVSDLGPGPCKNGPRAILLAGSSGRIYRVDNTARLWVMCVTTAADKIVIRVVKA